MKEFLCETQELAIGYGKTPLASGIALGANPGQILVLVGPNGAGKSTLLKTLAGQLAPLGGAVLLDGQDLTAYTGTARAQKLALMLPHTRHTELTTCFEFAAAGRIPYTGRLGILSDADRQAVQDALEIAGAAHLADRDFNCISDGQRQRVLLARAICQQPKVLLLDEPTSFLDIRHKLELLSTLKDMVRQRQLAVVMSLHELDLAQKVSDYVVCVHNNAIERYGPPEEIFPSDYIMELYGATRGSYNADFGCLEMEPARGKPEIFVIGGGGSGIPVYRQLQRRGIPFTAGVLQENDVDYPVAKALAVEVIGERSFEPIGESAFARAAARMKTCGKVLCCLREFGAMNGKNRELMELAKKAGTLTDSL